MRCGSLSTRSFSSLTGRSAVASAKVCSCTRIWSMRGFGALSPRDPVHRGGRAMSKWPDPWHGRRPTKAEVAAKVNEILALGWARVLEREEQRLREAAKSKQIAM